jgi:hypothetical protein
VENHRACSAFKVDGIHLQFLEERVWEGSFLPFLVWKFQRFPFSHTPGPNQGGDDVAEAARSAVGDPKAQKAIAPRRPGKDIVQDIRWG